MTYKLVIPKELIEYYGLENHPDVVEAKKLPELPNGLRETIQKNLKHYLACENEKNSPFKDGTGTLGIKNIK